MEWKVYILFSDKLSRTYTGCSSDVHKRIKQHNAGKVRATKYGIPWQLIFEETIGSYREARVRERYFKNASGRKKISEILNNWRGGRVA